jgi:ribosome recycling factor
VTDDVIVLSVLFEFPFVAMLDHVQVDAYGSKAPLSSVAHVVLRNPSLIVVSPFESSQAQVVATAIRDCGLNLNPIIEDGNVKVPLPK